MVRSRSIGVSILLSVVTCGIYGMFWFVMLTDEVNELSDDHSTTGGMALLYSIITCGIYTFFWNYKMGKRMYDIQLKENVPANDNSILYIILNFIGLGIVSYAIIQSDINDIIVDDNAAH